MAQARIEDTRTVVLRINGSVQTNAKEKEGGKKKTSLRTIKNDYGYII